VGEREELEAAGERIEQLLDELRLAVIPREYERVEQVVRLVTELYGAGLERILAIVGKVDRVTVADLAADDLVASLLLVHGLHPDALEQRVEQALASVRPFLAAHEGDVELLDIDAAAGAVHLRLLGSCDGCPSSSVTLQLAVEKAIGDAAPEIVVIDVEAHDPELVPAGARDGTTTPVALGRKHAYEHCPSEVAQVAGA
jgi:Fe-S cluster biogenesis protein NfuA